MTVSTTIARVIAQGNGVTTVFSYSFTIPGSTTTDQTNAQLIKQSAGVNSVLSTGSWSITGVSTPLVPSTSGTFIYTGGGTPLATGETLTLVRTVPYTQPTTLTAQGAYDPDTVMRAMDNLCLQIQQLSMRLDEKLGVPLTEAAMVDLPTEINRASKEVVFDGSGQPTVTTD